MLFHEELKEFLGVKGDYPVGMCWAPKTPRSAGLTLVFATAYGHIYSFCVEKLPKGATPMYRDCPPIAAEDTARFTPLMATYDTQLKLFEEHMQHQEKEQEHEAAEKNDSEQQQQEEEKEEEGTQEKEKKKVADKDTFLPPPECTVVSVAADEASLKGFFVVTKTGTLILVSWKLEVIKRVELRSVVLGNGEADPQLTVKSILLNTKKRALIVVSDKGLSVVLNVDMAERPTEADAIVEDAKFVSFRANIACKDVTAVAFNNVFDLITVGRSNGFVENHFLEDGAQETKASKVYSTDQWGIPDGCK